MCYIYTYLETVSFEESLEYRDLEKGGVCP